MKKTTNIPSGYRLGLWVLGAVGLSGCASVSSEFVCSEHNTHVNASRSEMADVKTCADETSIDDGIVYYMPKRFIRVNVTVATVSDAAPKKNKKVTVTVVNNFADETLPDTRDVFLLRYNKNLIGENNMAIGVSNYGLLSVSRAETVNKSGEIAANLALDAAVIAAGVGIPGSGDAAGTGKPLSTLDIDNTNIFKFVSPETSTVTFSNVSNTGQCNDGTYSLLLDPAEIKGQGGTKSLCGVDINLKPLFAPIQHNDSIRIASGGPWVSVRQGLRKARNFVDVIHTQNTLDSVPGLFYKQDLPYRVSVCPQTYSNDCGMQDDTGGVEPSASFIALSPNESKIYFAPITETVFTDNSSDIRLVNGVVTSYKENTDSELLALSKLPANVLGAYTGAMGKIFSSIPASTSAESTAGTAAILGMLKVRRCQQAVAVNNPTGKTGDALTTAYSNIEAACSN